MNNVCLIGRITKDIEIKKTSDGKSYCGFSVAVDRYKDSVDFIPCKAWDATADNIAKYFHKGDKIGITGALSTRSWEDNGEKRFSMEVLVRGFDFVNSKKSDTTESKPAPVEDEPSGNLPFEL